MMTFDEFIKTWTGKHVDVDGVYPDQCMDLMHEYLFDVLDEEDMRVLSAPYAYQVYTDFDNMKGKEKFDRIANTPTGVPQKGDIVLIDRNVSGVTGVAGHVCIFIDGDANKFRSFDANYPTGTLPHIQEHSYKGVLGWLRPKAPGQTTITIDGKLYERLVDGSTVRKSLAEYLGISDPDTTPLQKFIDVIEGFKSRMTDLGNQVAFWKTETENREDQVSRLKEQVLSEQKLRTDVQDNLNKALKQLSDVSGSFEGQLSEKQTIIDSQGKQIGELQHKLTDAENNQGYSKLVTIFGLTLYVKKGGEK